MDRSRGVSCSVIGLAAAALLCVGCASQSGDDDDSASAGAGAPAASGSGGQLGSGGVIAGGTGGLGSGGSSVMPSGSGGGMAPMSPIGSGGTGSGGTGSGGTGSGGTGSGGMGSGGAVAMTDAGVAGAGTGGVMSAGTGGMMSAGTGGMGSGGAGGATNGAATFTAAYAIISAKCGGGLTGCHVTGSSGSLRMPDKATAYTNLVGVASKECSGKTRVIAGDADNSVLVTSVEGTACVDRMPRNRDPLTAAEIMTIRDWISAGAMND